MLYQIFSFLLDLAVGFISGACLLRLYMQFQRIPMSARSGNPVGPFVFALTDWIVLPLRRIFPAIGALDTASLVAVYFLQLSEFALLWLIAGGGAALVAVPLLAIFGLARLIVTSMTIALVVYAVLSWVPAHSVLTHLLERLVRPWLMPVRRFIPLLGGVDLSPFVVLVLLQIAVIVIGHLQAIFLGSI